MVYQTKAVSADLEFKLPKQVINPSETPFVLSLPPSPRLSSAATGIDRVSDFIPRYCLNNPSASFLSKLVTFGENPFAQPACAGAAHTGQLGAVPEVQLAPGKWKYVAIALTAAGEKPKVSPSCIFAAQYLRLSPYATRHK
jgi:hypothetical protein